MQNDIKICLLGVNQELLVAVPYGFKWHVAINGDWSKQVIVDELAYLSPDDERSSGSPWKVRFQTNYSEYPVYHSPLSDHGVPHPDNKIDYLSWDGQWWRAQVGIHTYPVGPPVFTFAHEKLKTIIPARVIPGNANCQA